ncbi:unnamed protein product [Mesocestoides corti]|uniref:Hedgehog protein n=2 Tax=Mesocestoides corti TaxID=53468 RepID=A0A3P6HQ98_MESCO|nr:unnamed protein product [Mesocestoides corti]
MQKLVSLIHNTWPNNDVVLRILDGWIRPPPTLLRQPKVVTKRGYTERRKQTLQMSVPEDLVDYEPPKRFRQVTGYHSSNSLGVKVANTDSRVVMQRPRDGANQSEATPGSSIQSPYSVYRSRYWGEELPVMGFDGYRRQQQQLQQHPVMMEEFHYAGRAVDMILVDARSSGSSRRSSIYPGKLAQLAYYGALFDWCYFARQGHVHCSVKPDSIITSQWFGCFPGSAKALSTAGSPIPLSALRVGDSIMTLDSATNTLRLTQVIAFIHRDEHQYSPWIEIVYVRAGASTTGTLRLTANHIVYRWVGEKTAVFASDVRPHDKIACDFARSDILCQVKEVRFRNSTHADVGVYAPLTLTGDMIVDGVYVSCFAHVHSEWLARLAMLPLRLKHALFGVTSTVPQTGVHRYADWLLQIARFLLPNQLFFSPL